MLSNKEIGHILITIIVLTFVVSFKETINGIINYEFILFSLIFLTLILLVNILAKKLTANFYESNLEVKIWEWQRYGFRRESKLNKPIPAGIIFPFIVSIISLGSFFLMTVLESNIEGTSARASKRHGIYRFTEMTDRHIGLIVSTGIIANLLLAIIAYLINLGELARLSIYYATFSLIPFGNLDGTKVFFGNKVWWFTLVVITLIFLSYALYLP